MTMPVALTIAGSDSSGGAGIQADLKTFAALGVYGASVITALTAQNTTGVSGIHPVPPAFVTAQIDAVFGDLAVEAVKIGMVAQPAVIDAIAAGLTRWSPQHVVLDPVMVATSGDRLLAAGRRRSAANEACSLGFADHAEPSGSGGVAGRACRAERSRDRTPGPAAARDGMSSRADQGRPRPGQRKHRLPDRSSRHHRAIGATPCDQEHPRHRLLAVVGHRGRPCQRRGPGNRGPSCQGLDQCRDRRGRSAWVSAAATDRSIIFMNFIEACAASANAGSRSCAAVAGLSQSADICERESSASDSRRTDRGRRGRSQFDRLRCGIGLLSSSRRHGTRLGACAWEVRR